MPRNNRLAEGDWDEFWDEQPTQDWEERLLSQPDYDQEGLEEDWEAQNVHVYRCPRCGAKKLVDAETLSFSKNAGACEECMWETHAVREQDDEDLDD